MKKALRTQKPKKEDSLDNVSSRGLQGELLTLLSDLSVPNVSSSYQNHTEYPTATCTIEYLGFS
jgi:hypothetical protein